MTGIVESCVIKSVKNMLQSKIGTYTLIIIAFSHVIRQAYGISHSDTFTSLACIRRECKFEEGEGGSSK